jgi:RNA polymerase sigma factor (sigma-70 family)
MLIAVVEQLPDTQLVVINAIYWEQLSQGQLAAELGITQQAIQRRHKRALRRIKEGLNGGGP